MPETLGLEEWSKKIDRLEAAKKAKDWEEWQRIAYGSAHEVHLDDKHK